MKAKTIFAILIVISMLITSLSFADILPEESTLPYADDGPFYHRNLSRTPDNLTMGSQMSVMHLYVPTQNTTGELGIAVEYLAGDCTAADPAGCEVVDTLYEAKPLVVTYEDGIEEVELGTGTGIRPARRLCRPVAGRRRHLEGYQPLQRGRQVILHPEERRGLPRRRLPHQPLRGGQPGRCGLDQPLLRERVAPLLRGA